MGPLAGLKVVEFAGIGPGPMAATILADLGADVIRLDRPEPSGLGIDTPTRYDLTLRGRRSLALDLKHPDGVALALDLLERADASIEGFRPGTMERIGLGPDVALARNPRLIYGRVTGFGQTGPLAQAAGHDLNYIALTGALAAIGRRGEKPTPPLNLVGDYAGGSLYLVIGMLAALLEARIGGRGQVVDAAMVDGAAHLMLPFYGWFAGGLHGTERGANLLDSGAAFYDTYECRDGRYVSVAPIEPKFRAQLFRILEIEPIADDEELRRALDRLFRTRTRDEWCRLLEGSDACFAPVLTLDEAPHHPHNRARGTFVEADGIVQPAPAPRFGRTQPTTPTPPERPGDGGPDALAEWGFDPARIGALRDAGVIRGCEAAES